MTLSLKGDSVPCLLALCELNEIVSVAGPIAGLTHSELCMWKIFMRFQNIGVGPESQWVGVKREIFMTVELLVSVE